MKNVTYISDHVGTWNEKLRHYDPVNGTTLSVYVNDKTNEIDVVQTNDEGESITTHLSAASFDALFSKMSS